MKTEDIVIIGGGVVIGGIIIAFIMKSNAAAAASAATVAAAPMQQIPVAPTATPIVFGDGTAVCSTSNNGNGSGIRVAVVDTDEASGGRIVQINGSTVTNANVTNTACVPPSNLSGLGLILWYKNHPNAKPPAPANVGPSKGLPNAHPSCNGKTCMEKLASNPLFNPLAPIGNLFGF